MTIFHQIWQ